MTKKTKLKRRWVQLGLDQARKPVGLGGWRPGAGRPKGRKVTPHDKRPEINPRHPLHVTWRAGDTAPNLRSFYPEQFIRSAIGATRRSSFGVVEYSIQSNHIHMLAEADSKRGLESGMRSLARRISARMKTQFSWTGRLFTRYHARALATPREVRNALRYVLLNMRHHVARPGERLDPLWIDPYSSAYWFDGWKQPISGNHELVARCAWLERPTAKPRTWLLSTGWRRWGLLAFDELGTK